MSTDAATWERMSSELSDAISAAGGDAKRERAAVARALAAYARARTAAGEPPFEHAVHFFAVDGRVLDVSVKPALHRQPVESAAFVRWTTLLESLPQRLDQLDAIASEG
jgi:hypothetical protein